MQHPGQMLGFQKDPVDQVIHRGEQAGLRGAEVGPGSLLRASGMDRSPFLLNAQELHKSVILVLSDDEEMSTGLILNRPGARAVDIGITKDGSDRKIAVPLRFGGQFSVTEKDPLSWIHNSQALRNANIGRPVGPMNQNIWQCTAQEVADAIGQGIASPADFFVATGVTTWKKGPEFFGNGIQDEVRNGNFEVIPEWQTQAVWDSLSQQEVLSNANFEQNLHSANQAWSVGASNQFFRGAGPMHNDPRKSTTSIPCDDMMVGIRGRMQNSMRTPVNTVFKSNVQVGQLSDDALRSWIATFLLGEPRLVRNE